MNTEEIWLLWVVAGILFIVLFIEAVFYLKSFQHEIRYLKKERRRAYSEAEYRYWTRRIRRQYIGLIPFVPRSFVRRENFKK